MKSFCLAAFLAAAASADGHSVNRKELLTSGVGSPVSNFPTLEGIDFSVTMWYKSSMNEDNEEIQYIGGQYQMSL